MVDADEQKVNPLGTLIMVAKFPSPGKCKTRLANDVGPDKAAEVSTASTMDLLERLAGLEGAWRRVLLYTPRERKCDFERILQETRAPPGSWDMMPMMSASAGKGSDLGEILADALLALRGDGAVVFIGTDCVTIPATCIHRAFAESAAGRAHICPAEDGGYVLLGLPKGSPKDVFSGVKWSCEETCESQQVAVTRNGLEISIGETLRDVDDIEDLEALREMLKRDALLTECCPRTSQLLLTAS